MTSMAIVSSVPTREEIIAAIPCPVIAAIAKAFPEVKVTEAGIERQSLIDALAKRGFSPRLLRLLNDALLQAARANGKDGTHFDAADLRKTPFFDALTTGIFRNGFNATRFEELMQVAKNGELGAPEIARMIRALAAEQKTGLKPILFTAAEYSALRQVTVGSGKMTTAQLESFFRNGNLGPRFHDPSYSKDLGRIGWSTAKTLVCYGAQVSVGYFTGNADLPRLSPLPPTAAAGAAAATERPKGKCPFGHG